MVVIEGETFRPTAPPTAPHVPTVDIPIHHAAGHATIMHQLSPPISLNRR